MDVRSSLDIGDGMFLFVCLFVDVGRDVVVFFLFVLFARQLLESYCSETPTDFFLDVGAIDMFDGH